MAQEKCLFENVFVKYTKYSESNTNTWFEIWSNTNTNTPYLYLQTQMHIWPQPSLAKELNDKQQLHLLILDFSKAIHLVAHKRLLSKLQYCGIRDQTLTWIKNWLTGRTQCVVVDRESSEDTAVKLGVPQGTVLGPLIFILYINDIGQHISSNIRLFADDCLLYQVIHNACGAIQLQKDLEQMCSWAKNYQITKPFKF